ncbi:MAG: DmsC/YnfH family molybdoenzyme membrane anchor subunit [Bacteroidales bacterium]
MPLLGFVNLSIACNHCKEAPCLAACPASAFSFDDETKAVIHNSDNCIGCKYCTWACPFDAPKYNSNTGLIEKCNFCNERLKMGMEPACSTNCPTGALSFGEIPVVFSPQTSGLSLKPIYPRIKVKNESVVHSVPRIDSVTAGVEYKDIQNHYAKRYSLKSILPEVPLAVFTFIGSLLVGWLSAKTVNPAVNLSFWNFMGLGIIAVLFSTIHLGKPLRAYRSIKNIRRSWLSREILLFGFFMGLGTIALLFQLKVLLVIAAFAGFIFLGAVEMLYFSIKKGTSLYINSANTVITAMVFLALFLHSWNVLIALLALKTMLFTVKAYKNSFDRFVSIATASLFRLSIGIFVPFFFLVQPDFEFSWIFASYIILGEFIGRLMYYIDFSPERPFDNLKESLLMKKSM